MTTRPAALVAALVLLLLPSLAAAHPGHGRSDPGSLWHYLGEPEHATVLLAIVAGAALVVSLARPRSRRDPQRGRRNGR